MVFYFITGEKNTFFTSMLDRLVYVCVRACFRTSLRCYKLNMKSTWYTVLHKVTDLHILRGQRASLQGLKDHFRLGQRNSERFTYFFGESSHPVCVGTDYIGISPYHVPFIIRNAGTNPRSPTGTTENTTPFYTLLINYLGIAF